MLDVNVGRRSRTLISTARQSEPIHLKGPCKATREHASDV